MILPCVQIVSDTTIALRLHIQPRSAKNAITGLQGEALKIRLTSPPVDGKANQALVSYLAKILHLPKSAINIRQGLQSTSKTVHILSSEAEKISLHLQSLIEENTKKPRKT